MKKAEAYQILGVSDKANQNEIKKAFRTLAAKHHPDKNPDNKTSEETFKKINTAYQILTGAEKADDDKVNDSFYTKYNANYDNFYDVNDMMKDFFNSAYRKQSYKEPAQPVYHYKDVFLNLELTFNETVFGGEREIEYDVEEYCTKCGGKGIHYKNEKCSGCDGKGYLTQSIKDGPLFSSYTIPCVKCGGSGRASETCSICNGKKLSFKHKKLKVKIPPVGNDRTTLSLIKQGNIYSANLISSVLINLTPQTIQGNFKLVNNNILSTKSIPLDILMYGGDVEVESVNGEINQLYIRPKTKTGDVYTLKKNQYVNGKGSFLVRIEVDYPQLTEELRQAIQAAYKPITTEENNGKTEESS